jgi:selenoprotein W-related protein
VTESLLAELRGQVEEWTLVPSSGGRFEFEVDGVLIFSKAELKRHTSVEELRQLLIAHGVMFPAPDEE